MIEKGRKTEEEIEKRIMWESIYQKVRKYQENKGLVLISVSLFRRRVLLLLYLEVQREGNTFECEGKRRCSCKKDLLINKKTIKEDENNAPSVPISLRRI